MLHRASLRADQSVFCSAASRVNSKSPDLWLRAICFACDMLSLTLAFVPENLAGGQQIGFGVVVETIRT